MVARLRTRARDAILTRRYAPAHPNRSRRTACLWPRDVGGHLQMLTGHADQSKTRSGRLFNLRIRLKKRFGLSAYGWRL